MTTLLISGGQLVDELSVRRADLLIADGRVVSVLKPEHGRSAEAVLDAAGLHILPGLVNAHDHLELNHYGRLGAPGHAAGGRSFTPPGLFKKRSGLHH